MKQWQDAYEDLIPENSDGSIPVPLYGVRFAILMGADNQPKLVYQFDNTDCLDLMQLAGYLAALHAKVLRDFFKQVEEVYED